MAKRPRLQKRPHREAYTQEELAQILQRISLRPEGDRARFVEELDEIAWHGCCWEGITTAAGTPSEQERKWRTRAKQVAKLADWLEELYGHQGALHSEDGIDEGGIDCLTQQPVLTSCDFDRACLHHAAQELTAQEGSAHPWNLLDQTALEQLWKLHELLPWLQRCCEAVADRAAAEKAGTGGNRPSEGLEYLVRHLAALFKKHSAEPATAYTDRVSGEACGRLVEFLESCLEPLGYQGSRSSILDAIEKIRRKHPDLGPSGSGNMGRQRP